MHQNQTRLSKSKGQIQCHLVSNIYNDVIIFKTQVCDVATILELVVVLAKEDALKG